MYRRVILPGLALVLAASLAAFYYATAGGEQLGRWQVLSEATSSHATSFNSLMFFDESNGLGLTALGLESTSDGGKNWTLRLGSGHTHGFYAMWFSDQFKGWILGTERTDLPASATDSAPSRNPLMLRTNDGGITWAKVELNDLPKSEGARFTLFSSMCFDPAGKAWIVGDAGIVEGTVELNKWRTMSFTASSRALNSVACDNTRQVWAVGDGGLIMRYQGQSWRTTAHAGGIPYFTRVKIVGPDIWLAGGTPRNGDFSDHGLLMFTRNGQDWEDKTPSASETLYDVEFKGNEGWAVGARGEIYHTFNRGSTWVRGPSRTSNDLMSIFLLDERRGWIGGDKLTVLGLKEQLPR